MSDQLAQLGKIEMTLTEMVDGLPPTHLARQEFRDLLAEGVNIAEKLMRLKPIEEAAKAYFSALDEFASSDGSDASISNKAMRAEDKVRRALGIT